MASDMAFMHPDVEFRRVGAQPPLRGFEQVRAWMEPSAFERQVVEPIGAGSGIEVEIDAWNVITVDDELRVTRFETCLPHEEDEARRAAAVADPGSSG